MNRRSKIIGGATVAAAAVAGLAVPAYSAAASASAPAVSIPGAPATGATASGLAASSTTAPDGSAALKTMADDIAKDFGTDTAGVKSGLMAGKSLAQIAASNQVSRSTLLTRLDARVTANTPKLINVALPVGAMAGKMPAMPTMAGTSHGKAAGDPKGMNGMAMLSQLGVMSAVNSVSATLKLTPMELFSEVMKGQTLQQIATKQKVSTATLLTSLNKEANAVIAKAIDLTPPTK